MEDQINVAVIVAGLINFTLKLALNNALLNANTNVEIWMQDLQSGHLLKCAWFM